jgi:hypothetical protein
VTDPTTEQERTIERMSRAARPTLFEASLDPELLFALVLSNLMSPWLWQFRTTIERNALAMSGRGDPQALLMDTIQHEVDNHFVHLLPLDIEEIWGDLDLAEERARLGDRCIDDAAKVVAEEMSSRQAHGEAMARLDVRPLLERGVFPDYAYSTVDLLRAERRILRRKKHKPLGITCCAEEAVLICSLGAVLHGIPLDELVIFGSVGHYTAFLRHGDDTCWFNGKREYFLRRTWAQQAARQGGSQNAFDARLASFDRIIAPSGCHLLHDGLCTMGPGRLEAIEAALAAFFGLELRQVAAARTHPRHDQASPLRDVSLAALDHARDVDELCSTLRALAADHPGTILEAAFYAFRDLDVRHPEAYLRAALRGRKARRAAADFGGLDDAIACVRAIEGAESIFGTRERISLPDEVLTLRTGSDRDKALLLYALLQHAPRIGPADKKHTELLLTEDDSFVRIGDRYLNTRTFEPAVGVQAPVLLRFDAAQS